MTFEYVPFFNQGLMSGQSKVGKVSGEPFSDYMRPTYALQQEAVMGASNRDQSIREFHHRHREHLNEVSDNGFFGYTVPTEYCGLGMCSLPDIEITHSQRRIATLCRSDKLACKSLKRLECLDEQFMPLFTQPKEGGEEVINFSTVSRGTVSEHPVRFLTPYIKVLPEQCLLDDIEYDKRVCTSKCIRDYFVKRLKSEKNTQRLSRYALFRGFVVSKLPVIPVGPTNRYMTKNDRCSIPFKQRNFSLRFDTRFDEPVLAPGERRNRAPIRHLRRDHHEMDLAEEMAADGEQLRDEMYAEEFEFAIHLPNLRHDDGEYNDVDHFFDRLDANLAEGGWEDR